MQSGQGIIFQKRLTAIQKMEEKLSNSVLIAK